MQAEVEAELDKVVRALGDFYTRETHLLDKDLGERALTHRLAVHLENRFPGWDVDCDYNRLGERRLAAAEGIDRLNRRRQRKIGVSRYYRASPHGSGKPARHRVAKSHQPSAGRTRPAQAAGDDRPAPLARLQGRGVADTGEEERRGAGSLRGRRGRRRTFRVVVPTVCWPADGDIVADNG